MGKMEEVKKTSEEWLKSINEHSKVYTVIHDPDGWNRKDYNFSFKEELVTRKEFFRRLGLSTCLQYPNTKNLNLKDGL